jgi:hypothetical protein
LLRAVLLSWPGVAVIHNSSIPGWPQGPAEPAGSLSETRNALKGLLDRTPIGRVMNNPEAQTALGMISPLAGALSGTSPLGVNAQMGADFAGSLANQMQSPLGRKLLGRGGYASQVSPLAGASAY